MSSETAAKRGEIWDARLDPVEGHGQAGAKRPVLIISHDRLNRSGADLCIVLVLSSTMRPGVPSHVAVHPPEGGVALPSDIMCEHIRTVARQRLLRRRGQVEAATLTSVEEALKRLLALP